MMQINILYLLPVSFYYIHFILQTLFRIQKIDILLGDIIYIERKIYNIVHHVLDDISYFSLIKNYNFSQEWVHNIVDVPDYNYHICPFCNFQPSSQENLIKSNNYVSTKRDLIMTIYIQNMNGMIILARSLRTTSCKASIIYFVDSILYNKVISNIQYYEFFQGCGIKLINFGNSPSIIGSVVNYRFIFFSEFMRKFYKNYDKVIIADGFDTAFQSDPFCYEWDNNTIYLTHENQKNAVSIGWYTGLYQNENVQDVINSKIINNGVVAGYSEIMYHYLDFFTRAYDWEKWTLPYDQAHLNY